MVITAFCLKSKAAVTIGKMLTLKSLLSRHLMTSGMEPPFKAPTMWGGGEVMSVNGSASAGWWTRWLLICSSQPPVKDEEEEVPALVRANLNRSGLFCAFCILMRSELSLWKVWVGRQGGRPFRRGPECILFVKHESWMKCEMPNYPVLEKTNKAVLLLTKNKHLL